MRLKVLCCGSRDWSLGSAPICHALELMGATEVVHGGARGVDSAAGVAAKKLGLSVEVFPADWGRYGRTAGPIRNREMLVESRPALVLAFVDCSAGCDQRHDPPTPGTLNMVKLARTAGVPVEVVHVSRCLRR